MKAGPRGLGRLAFAFVAALLVWLAAGDAAWGSAVVTSAELAIRSLERPRVTRLDLDRSEVEVHRSDMGSDSEVPAFDVSAFTAPTVVFLALVWGAGRFVPRRGAWRAFAALAILFAAQTVHLVLAIETLYATQLGEWSTAFYPRWERELLAAGRSLFDIVLAWGLPLALWVGFYGLPAFRAAETSNAKRPGRKGRAT